MLPVHMQGLTPEQFNRAIIHATQQVVDMSQIDEIMSEMAYVAREAAALHISAYDGSGKALVMAAHPAAQRLMPEYADIYDDM
jgi:chromosome segregation and condensation protein ScpB